MGSFGFSLRQSSMNDFPPPEGPPVMITAENSLSAARARIIGPRNRSFDPLTIFCDGARALASRFAAASTTHSEGIVHE